MPRGTELGPQVDNRNEMNTAPHRCKILAHMFRRIIRNLDQIQNSSTAQACVFDQSKIDIAKDAIHDVAEELEARAAADIEQRKGAMQKMEPRERPPAPPPNVR
jgi:hypothetical protein